MAAEEEEEEEDEGIAPEPNASSSLADATEAPKEARDDVKQKGEEDELAEYDLDKYDEEDTGEGERSFVWRTLIRCSLLLTDCLC